MSNISSLVFTVIGKDRPGIVHSLSQAIKDHGGSWQESSLSQVAGQFAGLVHVTLPEGKRDACIQAILELEKEGLAVHLAATENQQETVTTGFSITAHDRPGIVEEIMQILTESAINVVELQTNTASAPMSPENLFLADVEVELPKQMEEEDLQGLLESLSDDFIIDLEEDAS